MEFYEQIKEYLNNQNVKYEEFDHEPVFTSEQAAQVREGGSLAQGAKALIFDIGRPIMFVLRGVDKVDGKLAKSWLNVKEVPMATKENVLKYTGVEVGAVAPFGFLRGIETYVDETLFTNEYIMFNPGKHNKTIKLLSKDYQNIPDLKIVNFRKL